MNINLPTWNEVHLKKLKGEYLSPIDDFIYTYESHDEDVFVPWREKLLDCLEYVFSLTSRHLL
jgi:hypothetical protein